MRRDEALRILREQTAVLAQLGVTSLSVFGSVARDEAHAGSDVDLLVEFDGRPIGLFEFLEVKERLERALGTRVDLVMRDTVKPQLRERIFGEAQLEALLLSAE